MASFGDVVTRVLARTGGFGEIFHRNNQEGGVWNYPGFGPLIGDVDLFIEDNCHQNEYSYSILGCSYGSGSGLNHYALFGHERFRVFDYEVFKIVIE
jgi:hypothetical protein